jgi:sugar lactone lactonase YvrE
MSDTFNCPNCGAPLDYQGSDPIIRCPYCSTSVVVPDNLRAKPSFSPQPSNFTLSGAGDVGSLLQKAMRFKEVKDLAQAGNKLEAIRLYREITNADLETARTAVEALAANQPITMSGFSKEELKASLAQVVSHDVSGPVFSAPRTFETRTVPRSNNFAGCFPGCFIIGFVTLILAIVFFSQPGALGPNGILSGLPIPGIGFAIEQLSFGGNGIGPGLFSDLRPLAVDPASGAIFAADYSGGRIQAFDPSGKFITQWTVKSKYSDIYITGMAADRKGHVFVVESGSIHRYDTSGALQKTIQIPDINLYNLVVGADGNLVAAAHDNTIVRLTPEGDVLDTFKNVLSENGGAEDASPIHVAVDGEGNIYVLSTKNNAVFKFSSNGKFINRFGSKGKQNGQFSFPTGGIAVDGFGRVYVADFQDILVFDDNGLYQNMIFTNTEVFSVTFDDQNNLYATARTHDDMSKLSKFNVQKPDEN